MLFDLSVIRVPLFDPVAFRLGPLAVHWYGLAYMAGFLLAYFFLYRLALRGYLRLKPELVGDLIFWAALGVIVGGRLGWWFFYHRNEGRVEPWWEPFAMWHGGMSFHGGLLGVILALAGWARFRRVSLLNIGDAAALVTPVGLFFGRIANFVNGELIGRIVPEHMLPWWPGAVIYPAKIAADLKPRFPSQLYEAFLEGPLLLAVLWLVWRLFRPRDGRIMFLFPICYGIFRFVVEFTRLPDPQLGYIAFGWLTMGQILSLALVVGGLAAWLFVPAGGAAELPKKGGGRK